MAKYIKQFLFAIILLSCSVYTQTEEEMKKNENEIYQTLAAPYCDSGIVYINPELISFDLSSNEINSIKREFSHVSEETLAAYILKNSSDYQVVEVFKKFPIECEYKFVDFDTEEFMCNDINCITPIGFSPIGFNKRGDKAMVYMYWVCSECGGWGGLYFLEKKDNSWVIVKFIQFMVS